MAISLNSIVTFSIPQRTNRRNPRWFQAAVDQKAGRISITWMTKEVHFEPVVEENLNVLIDKAYREKYSSSSYLSSMISERARAATVRIMPRKNV